MKNECNVLIGGEAGQGLVTIGEVLTKALVRSDFNIIVTQDYQSRVRGGHNTFSVRYSTEEIWAPREQIDLLVALNKQSVDLHSKKLAKNGFTIADVPFKENTAYLGAVTEILKLDLSLVTEIIHERFKSSDEDKFLNVGIEWAKSQHLSIPSPSRGEGKGEGGHKRLMFNGNDAISFGALSAGVKFCSFYPMTPATTISLNLAKYSEKMGVIVEQAEDEIAAINMALGASYAGLTSMVATSGGGFALMVEGVSLAGMTETPIVVVVGQRPGPATGLPTRTEQADFEFVLHSGHGEFPRIVFSPGTVEECFHLTRKAFELAEKYQSPVFILTDQFLADSFRAVKQFDTGKLSFVTCGANPRQIKLPYNRYELSASGVSPRLLPGQTENIVIAGSDEHTTDGHLTEDLNVRVEMVNKRLRKMNNIMNEIVPPEYIGHSKPDILYVCFGSTKGSVLEVVNREQAKKKKVAMLHFSQMWPIDPKQFLQKIKNIKKVITVESNAFGQLARLIRRETGFEIKQQILKYDGLPITPEYIYANI